MSGIGFTEMLLLAVIALIVVGPQRLPGIARTAGRWSRQARAAWQGIQSELQAELDLDHNRKIMQASPSADAGDKPSAESEVESSPSESIPSSDPTSASQSNSDVVER